MVERLPFDNLAGHLGSQLVDVMAEILLYRMRPRHQQLLDPHQRIADFAEKLVHAPHLVSVVTREVEVRLDLLLERLAGVELQKLCAVMVEPDDGMEY